MSSYTGIRSIIGFDPDCDRQCLGKGKSSRQKCTNSISIEDRRSATRIMDRIDHAQATEDDFTRLAGLMLCKRWHNSSSRPDLCQIPAILSEWHHLLQDERNEESTGENEGLIPHRGFREILGFNPDSQNQCVGIAKTTGQRCKLTANKFDCISASHLMNGMDRAGLCPTQDTLKDLASLMLCNRWHNPDQIPTVLLTWNRLIGEELGAVKQQKAARTLNLYDQPLVKVDEMAKKTRIQVVEAEGASDKERKKGDENITETITHRFNNSTKVSQKPTIQVTAIEVDTDVIATTTPEVHELSRRTPSRVKTAAAWNMYPPTPDITPPHRQISLPVAGHNQPCPSTPTRASVPSEINDLPAIISSVTVPGARSDSESSTSAEITKINFGFTHPPTPPSSAKSRKAASKIEHRNRPSTPTRAPLGVLSTSKHNRTVSKEVTVQSFPSLPALSVFNFQVAENSASSDLKSHPQLMRKSPKQICQELIPEDHTPTKSSSDTNHGPREGFGSDSSGHRGIVEYHKHSARSITAPLLGSDTSEALLPMVTVESSNPREGKKVNDAFITQQSTMTTAVIQKDGSSLPKLCTEENNIAGDIGYITVINTASYRTTYGSFHNRGDNASELSIPCEMFPMQDNISQEVSKQKSLPLLPNEPGAPASSLSKTKEQAHEGPGYVSRSNFLTVEHQKEGQRIGCFSILGLQSLKDKTVRNFGVVRARLRLRRKY